MAGNSFGEIFRITTWGESHGPAIGVTIDGCPAGLAIDEKFIQKELDRRRPGQSKVTTARGELDKANILAGVYDGLSTGTPISIIIYNKDADSSKYDNLKDVFRPGHADFTYAQKYGLRDHRGGGRSSARETACRVAAGAVAKLLLKHSKVKINAYTVQVGKIKAATCDLKVIEKNTVRCCDMEAAKKMESAIMRAKKAGDSLGAIIEIVARGVPIGLGEPVYDKLEADLGKAILSINAIKGVEFGAGFAAASMKGSEFNDPLTPGKWNFAKNDAGGILGGISTGQDISMRLVIRPTASISQKQSTVNTKGKKEDIQVLGRHDPCLAPRAVPVAESMVALVLADHLLRNRTSRI